ncbi:hypothetical protein MKX64_08765 [Paenibacillus sp. FSL M8-0334]|uniref:hypothetical protein n=1 Tax=Paenibacillus sp. FSL M8-0334 TaxID=2921623 RepID=UPI0030F8B0AE
MKKAFVRLLFIVLVISLMSTVLAAKDKKENALVKNRNSPSYTSQRFECNALVIKHPLNSRQELNIVYNPVGKHIAIRELTNTADFLIS